MAWTYSTYSGANYGISIGLGVFILLGVYITFHTSKKGREFIHNRIVGIEPTKVNDDDDDDDDDADDADEEAKKKKKAVPKPPKAKKNTISGISCLLCFLGALALLIAAILIFQGCFLLNIRLLADDDCPDYAVDCFVFNGTSSTPLNETPSFYCVPNNKTQFPGGLSNGTAQCFGWIIMKQTTKDFMDQLGVCTGLIGLFTTLLAIVVYLGKSVKSLILSTIFVASCIVAAVLFLFYKWSYAPLTYAVLGLCLGLGIFGMILYCILPKPEKTTIEVKPIVPTDPNKAQTSNDASIPGNQASSSKREPPPRTITVPRSNRVALE